MKNPETAKRINEAMEDLHISAKELSDRSEVSQASISQYMNGSHAPSNISAQKIGNVLRVNPMWLMGFDVGKHAPLTNVKFEDRLLEAYHKAPEYIQKTINDLLGL
jgi:transcriptional regulator with XRE-family HTH domain